MTTSHFSFYFSTANIQKLIKLVRERRDIYDFNCPGFRDRDLDDKNWEEISSILQINVSDCRQKWRNLRNSFSRDVRRRAKLISLNDQNAKPYYLANELKFLTPFLNSKTQRNESSNEGDDDDNDDDDDCILIERKPECIEINESDDDKDTEILSINNEETDNNQKVIKLVVSSLKKTQRPRNPRILNETLIKQHIEEIEIDPSLMQIETNNTLLSFVETKLTNDYDKLNTKNQRNFKRRCLEFLHDLLNEQDFLKNPKKRYVR